MELFKVNKELGKLGLHRDLITNITFRLDTVEELEKCSFIFIENMTRDTYVYLEEIKKVKEFKFWPHIPMNIEIPASESKGQ